MVINLQIAEKLFPVFQGKARYRVSHGGRGGGKSWSFADVLLLQCYQKTTRALCARELQNSIKDSVHKLLSDRIQKLGFSGFEIGAASIKHANGSEIIFKGLRSNAQEIKSMEGIDICWVEEAQGVSQESWDFLIPTIRKPGSEIWVTFNPGYKHDPTSQRFIEKPPENARIVKVNWYDNPWISQELIDEMNYLKATDTAAYRNVWLGEYRQQHSGGLVVKGWASPNIDESLAYRPNLPLYLTCDFNVDPMCWLVAHKPVISNINHYEFIDELCIENTNIVQTVREFTRRYGKHKAGLVVTGDATGQNRSDTSPNPNDTKYKILMRELSDEGMTNISLDLLTANPHEDIRVEGFNRLICTASGVRRVKVHPRCKRLIWNMENLHYIEGSSVIFEPNRSQIEKDITKSLKYTKHPFDAASYLTNRYDPIRRDTMPKPVSKTVTNVYQPVKNR